MAGSTGGCRTLSDEICLRRFAAMVGFAFVIGPISYAKAGKNDIEIRRR
jgi:hypothetical protein